VSELKYINWRWRHFDLFAVREWHDILALRAAIFVVEQDCPYLDPDDKDPQSFHLEAHCGEQLIGTLRSVPPGISYDESSIGRVAIHEDWRGHKLGRALMQRAIAFNQAHWGPVIRIGAQVYLRAFYESLGFAAVGEAYDEDGIPHIDMLLSGGNSG
jgi:ElaA protein